MAELMNASDQLVTRPADEHFASFRDMQKAARTDQANHREVELPLTDLRFTSLDGTLRVMRKEGGHTYGLTHYSFGQICQAVGSRREFLGSRLSLPVAVTALNDAVQHVDDGAAKLLLGTVTNSRLETAEPVLRAITSPGYCRVWDADLLNEVNEWLLPNGFTPALPTINTDAQRNNILGNNKPCLFRGDRGTFSFYMTPEKDNQDGHGDRPVRRGVIVGNSEVGQRSLWTKRFVLDEMCANFIIWGAKVVKTQRIIHRGSSDRNLLRRFRTELRQCTPGLAKQEIEILRKANKTFFAPSTKEAAARLAKQFGLTEAFAQQALAAATDAENRGTKALTHAWIANGVTSAAKATGNADTLAAMAEVGGDIFAAAV